MTFVIVEGAPLEGVTEDAPWEVLFAAVVIGLDDTTAPPGPDSQTAGLDVDSTEVVVFDTIRLTGDGKFQDTEMPIFTVGVRRGNDCCNSKS